MGHYFLSLIGAFLLSFSVLAATPVISNLNPAVGAAAGGASITIKGSKFSGTTSVLFGNTPAASFTVNSDSSITATIPAHTPEVVSVTITSPSGTTTASSDSFFTFQGDIIAYIVNSNSNNLPGQNTVSAINTRTNSVIGTVPVGNGPNALNILPDASLVYVANTGFFLNGTTVSVIASTSLAVVDTITVGIAPNAVAVTPNGKQVYTANTNDVTVSAINTATHAVTTISAGNAPNSIASTTDGTQVLFGNFFDNNVQIINPNTNTAGAPISTGSEPSGIAFLPNRPEAYVLNSSNSSNTVTAINLSNTTPQNITLTGRKPFSLAITPQGNKVYVANFRAGDNTTSVIDPSTNTVVNTITGNNPDGVVINTAGTFAYIANEFDGIVNGTVSVVNTSNDTLVATVSIGVQPNAMNISPDGTQVYVACKSSNEISAVDATNNTLKATIPVGQKPSMIIFAPDQAPLAKFTVTEASLGVPIIFDASQSVSPTGQITTYSWNFGDGTTLVTTHPLTRKVYAARGHYTVTLTVTNSAGTSTTQIYNYSAYNNIKTGTLSMPLTNNGGPTAMASKTIVIRKNKKPETPSHFRGHRFKEDKHTIKLTWKPSRKNKVVKYKITRNKDKSFYVLATKPAVFKDHHRKKNKSYLYSIRAISSSGPASHRNWVTIPRIEP